MLFLRKNRILIMPKFIFDKITSVIFHFLGLKTRQYFRKTNKNSCFLHLSFGFDFLCEL